MDKLFTSGTFNDIEALRWLRTKFFSNPEQRMDLKVDEIIMTQGEKNEKLYYVESGQLSGFLQPENGVATKVFTIGPNLIAGIYSFFSPDGNSYATVKADEDTVLYYVDKDEIPGEDHEDHCAFHKHILPVIVNEIYVRQIVLMKSASEKQAAMKKLFQTEKLATLGQLAAGLAHELNNAIGVIENKTIWLTDRLKEYFYDKSDSGAYRFFENGLKSGQAFSSSEIRERKRELQKKIKIDDNTAKKLARIDLTDDEIDHIAKNGTQDFMDRIDYYWQIGLALHDMNIAAGHTSHVVKSIKELGAQGHSTVRECDLSESISKALALLTSFTKNVEVELNLDSGLILQANEGKLIQVWVNLIKNATESLIQSRTNEPKILITSQSKRNEFEITVTDNGPGINKNVLPTIFQPNVTTKLSGQSLGLGLGLSIVQRIIVAMEGNIEVESAPGNTIFKISIPK
jgi:signal transduction histidine kinase